MKLFSPAESQQRTLAQNQRDTIRTQEIREELMRLQSQLATKEQEFALLLAGQRDRWADEEKAHGERIDEMTREIAVLQRKKQEALIPIEEEYKKLDTIRNDVETRLSEVTKKEIELEEAQESLKERVELVSDTEHDLQDKESVLEKRIKILQEERDMFDTNSRHLSDSIKKYNDYVTEKQIEIASGQRDVYMKNLSLEARKSILDDKESVLIAKERRLASEREVLDAAFRELRNGRSNGNS